MAKFPREVWDGTTPRRLSLDAVTAPDHSDWMALTRELQATQRYILNLSGSLEAMPNFDKLFKEAAARINSLFSELELLTPPADLQGDIAAMQQKLENLDTRTEHERLKNGVKKLFLRSRAFEAAFKTLKKDVYHQLSVLTHSYRNQFTKLEESTRERTDKLQLQIAELQDVLEIPELGD